MLLQIVDPTPPSQIPSSVAVGIDLGTTHSLVALSRTQKAFILEDSYGPLFEPSLVAYIDAQNVFVGSHAQQFAQTAPAQVIRSIKRLMGRSTKDVEELRADPKFSFDLEAPEGIIRLKIGEKSLTPVEISAEILKHLKKRSEEALGCKVSEAVITVPAYFDEAARTATRDAARLAGLEVLRLVNEPTAAALAYGLDKGLEGLYAIYDLGGGTFDFSVLRLEKGVFQVIATGGDTHLGGDDFDALIVHEIMREKSTPLSSDDHKRTLDKARALKEILSQQKEAVEGLSRARFEALIMPLVQRTLGLCGDVLQSADLKPEEIQGVVLVGGSTRIPLVIEKVKEFFGQEPLRDIHPEEAVALGAALQAEALTRGSDDMLLLDVVPLSLGIEMMGGLVEKIIYRNTPLPTTKTQEFTTYQNGQTAIKFHVVQGERELAKDCRSLGQFELRGLPPKAAGSVRVQVSFTVDVDGLLTVQAQDKETGIAHRLEVKPTSGLTEDELEQMILTSLKHGAEDMQARLLTQARLGAEKLSQTVEQALREDGDLLSEPEKASILASLQSLNDALRSASREEILNLHKKLQEATGSFAEKRIKKVFNTTEKKV